MTTPMRLDVFSDIACPWCYLGKRRLQKAVAESGQNVEVHWHAYQLDPSLPPEGTERGPYFTKKFGSLDRLKGAHDRLVALGRADGIEYAFDKQERVPNTRLAHRVLKLAERSGVADQAMEALFSGYFESAADVTKLDVVLELLAKKNVQLDANELRNALADGAGDEEVEHDLALARQIGISGVPFFIGNGVVGMSGAQDVETFVSFLEEARKRATEAPPAG